MKHYTKNQLKTFHSIRLNSIFKELHPEGDYFANAHLASMSDTDLIKAIIKKQNEKRCTQTKLNS